MKKIKNLKINWKKTISVLLTSTIITTLSGCCLDNHEEVIENQNNTISSLEQEKTNLEQQKAKLEQEKAKLQEQLNKLTATPEPTQIPAPEVVNEENSNSDNLNNLTSDAAIHLFYENGVLKVDSIGEPYYLKYYSYVNGGPDTGSGPGYVQEIVKNGKKYLVDANDFSIVLASDYKSITQNDLNTTIEFADGHTEVYANKDFKPSRSYVLTQ